MASLVDVQLAIKQGDEREARTLLKDLLAQAPSADAWYMAAQMSTDPESIVRCLNRALLIDPNHTASQRKLDQMGKKRQAATRTIWQEIQDSVYEASDRVVVLRSLPRFLQMSVFLTVLFSAIVGLSALAMALLPGPLPQVAEVQPTPVPAVVTSVDDFLRQMAVHGVTITYMEETQANNKQVFRLMVTDSDQASHEVLVFVYDRIADLIDDAGRIQVFEQSSHVQATSNFVLIYPHAVSPLTASMIESSFTASQSTS